MSRRVRISFIGWGDHVHVERWASSFPALGFDVSVLSTDRRGRYPPGVRQFALRTIPAAFYRLRVMLLKLFLKLVRPDLVHVHYAGTLASMGDSWDGPLIVTAWGSDILRADRLDETGRELVREKLGHATCVTCDSGHLAQAVASFCPAVKDRIEVVQWGVDTDVFSPGAPTRDPLTSFGIAGDPLILSPRAFYPLYRLETVVDAFARVKERHPKAGLLMKRYHDEPDYLARIQSQIADLGLSDSVRILDRVAYEEMADFYRSGGITVSVPETDGTPMSVLEAMACGSVPVVSDVPSLREWIVDGENGRLVEVGDAEALAAAVIGLLESPEVMASMRERNLEIVRTRASQRANMERMRDIYHQVASGSYAGTAS